MFLFRLCYLSLAFAGDTEVIFMSNYQLQIKQIVDYPRCRIYRNFIQELIRDHSLHAKGGCGLFRFTVFCSYANFRTSYRKIDGISYTVYPGEWVCTIKENSSWFRTRFLCSSILHRKGFLLWLSNQKRAVFHGSRPTYLVYHK